MYGWTSELLAAAGAAAGQVNYIAKYLTGAKNWWQVALLRICPANLPGRPQSRPSFSAMKRRESGAQADVVRAFHKCIQSENYD